MAASLVLADTKAALQAAFVLLARGLSPETRAACILMAQQNHTLDGAFAPGAQVECAAASAMLYSDGTLQLVGVTTPTPGKAEQL